MTRLIAALFLLLAVTMSWAHEDDFSITPIQMKQVVKAINTAINEDYLYPEKARWLNTQLQVKLTEPHLQFSYDRAGFRQELRQVIVSTTQDKNIDVVHNLALYEDSNHIKNGQIIAEVSEQKIGYLSLTGDLTNATKALDDAIKSMPSHSRLILDLRQAESIDLAFTLHLMSYFIKGDTLVGYLQTQSVNKALYIPRSSTEHSPTIDVPVYILHSAFVSGNWEFFSQVLQNIDNAVIVGENTMGVGYISKRIEVGNDVILELPYGSLTPIGSDYDWGQYGVTPNHFTNSEKAIEVAYRLAMSGN